MNARYNIIQDDRDCLCIRDIGPWDLHQSVTNDAENVVVELAARLGERRLEYIDSDGRRDRILVNNGRFAGFASI